jgi:hypothetical protein
MHRPFSKFVYSLGVGSVLKHSLSNGCCIRWGFRVAEGGLKEWPQSVDPSVRP